MVDWFTGIAKFVVRSEMSEVIPIERMVWGVGVEVSDSATPSKLKLRIINFRMSSVGSMASESVSARSVDASLHASSAVWVCCSAFATKTETMNAVDMNTSNSTMFSRWLMRKVWYGGMRNQFAITGAHTAVTNPGQRPPIAVIPTTARRYSDKFVATEMSVRNPTKNLVITTKSAIPTRRPAMFRPGEWRCRRSAGFHRFDTCCVGTR